MNSAYRGDNERLSDLESSLNIQENDGVYTLQYTSTGPPIEVVSYIKADRTWYRQAILDYALYFKHNSLFDAYARYSFSCQSSDDIYFQDELIPVPHDVGAFTHYLKNMSIALTPRTTKAGKKRTVVIINGRLKRVRSDDCREEDAILKLTLGGATSPEAYIKRSDDTSWVSCHDKDAYDFLKGQKYYVVHVNNARDQCLAFRNKATHRCDSDNCRRTLLDILREREGDYAYRGVRAMPSASQRFPGKLFPSEELSYSGPPPDPLEPSHSSLPLQLEPKPENKESEVLTCQHPASLFVELAKSVDFGPFDMPEKDDTSDRTIWRLKEIANDNIAEDEVQLMIENMQAFKDANAFSYCPVLVSKHNPYLALRCLPKLKFTHFNLLRAAINSSNGKNVRVIFDINPQTRRLMQLYIYSLLYHATGVKKGTFGRLGINWLNGISTFSFHAEAKEETVMKSMQPAYGFSAAVSDGEIHRHSVSVNEVERSHASIIVLNEITAEDRSAIRRLKPGGAHVFFFATSAVVAHDLMTILEVEGMTSSYMMTNPNVSNNVDSPMTQRRYHFQGDHSNPIGIKSALQYFPPNPDLVVVPSEDVQGEVEDTIRRRFGRRVDIMTSTRVKVEKCYRNMVFFMVPATVVTNIANSLAGFLASPKKNLSLTAFFPNQVLLDFSRFSCAYCDVNMSSTSMRTSRDE